MSSEKDEVTAETSVNVPILALFDGLTARLDLSDRTNLSRLDTQDKLLRRIDQRLDQAATKADIERVEVVVQRHENDISDLKIAVHEDEVEKTYRSRVKNQIGWVVAGVMVPLGAALILALHHT